MKRLLIDIETAPHLSYHWGLFNQNIGLNQVVQPGYMLCYAAKWYGKRGTVFDAVWKSGKEGMLEGLVELLDESDAVIHYNGKRFDTKRINGELFLAGILPPSPYRQIDLLLGLKKHMQLMSHKLEFVLKAKGLEEKLSHSGFGMWRGVMDGDPRAQREMERYNRRDVTAMEPLYDDLLPWLDNHPNFNLYTDSDQLVCTNCGGTELTKRGFARLTTGTYQEYRCRCGTYLRGTKRVDGTTMTQEKR